MLDGEQAEYGKRIAADLASRLAAKYGKTFEYKEIACSARETGVTLSTYIRYKSLLGQCYETTRVTMPARGSERATTPVTPEN